MNAGDIGQLVSVPSAPLKSFSLQVVSTATAWSVIIQGSLNGNDYDTILTHTKVTAPSGSIIFSGTSLHPSKFVRAKLVSVTLGGATNVVVDWLGMP